MENTLFINDINKTYYLLGLDVMYSTAESNNIIVLLYKLKKIYY